MDVKLTESTLSLLPVIKRKLKEDSTDQILNKAVAVLYGFLKTCESKKQYKNIKLAQAECQQLKDGGLLSPNHQVYRCPYCYRFHIGSARKGVVKYG